MSRKQMSGFEELNVWKLSLQLSVNLYKELKESKDWFVKDQVLRSALSISSNIAEGQERKTAKDFVRFLNIASASCAELRSQLHFLKETKIFENTKAEDYLTETRKISAMLVKLVNSIKTRNNISEQTSENRKQKTDN